MLCLRGIHLQCHSSLCKREEGVNVNSASRGFLSAVLKILSVAIREASTILDQAFFRSHVPLRPLCLCKDVRMDGLSSIQQEKGEGRAEKRLSNFFCPPKTPKKLRISMYCLHVSCKRCSD